MLAASTTLARAAAAAWRGRQQRRDGARLLVAAALAASLFWWASLCAAHQEPRQPVVVEACGIRANRLPPLVVPERYELKLDARQLAENKFAGQLTISARYTDLLPSSPRVTFLGLLKKICQSVLACGLDRVAKLRRRQILLNVGADLQIDGLQVERIGDGGDGGGGGGGPTPEETSNGNMAGAPGPEVDEHTLGPAGAVLEVDDVCVDRASQLLAITLAKKPAKGDLLAIRVEYRGRVRTDGRGFHQGASRAALVAPSGEDGEPSANYTETLEAGTHFFPADARTAFPCFDQPDMKAVFSLRLTHPADLVALSNTAPISSTALGDPQDGEREGDENNRARVTQFAQTPRMSSHLFAFALGRYETLTCQAAGKTRPLVTAHAPLGRAHEAQFTLNAVCRAIPLAESYLKRDFPLSKLDLVSTRQLPAEEPARENWGLLVIREEFLLTSERDTSPEVREEIAKLAAHLVLHQWWGNLVTAAWWHDQWLFEGFAIWRSHALAAELQPELFSSNEFNYLLRLQSVQLDAHTSASARPIRSHQDLSADEELALLDANTSNKAAALYQMTSAWLVEYVLRDALTLFLNSHAYAQASAHNLTQALDSISGLSLTSYLDSWLDQPGVPLVSVARVNRNELELSQERLLRTNLATAWAAAVGIDPFVATPSNDGGAEQNNRGANNARDLSARERKGSELWSIPIDVKFSDSNSLTETVRITLREARTRLKGPAWFRHFERGHWFKLNVNFSGFYRVSYPQNVLAHLRAPIEEAQGAMSAQDRFNIIDDLRALYTLNKIPVSELLQVLAWFKRETHGGVLSGLALVVDALSERESFARVAEITLELFSHVFEQHRFKVLGPEGAHQDHAQLIGRQDALVRLIQYGHEPATEEAVQVFEASDVHLEPFLRRPVYLAVLKRGTDSQIDELLKRLRETKPELEHSILINFLVQFVAENNNELRSRLMATLADGTPDQ